ncbi:MAG: hypothetical protein IT429_14775 [Gemmataceae bacterium]|nr:hypothetical protein [Gemmataceae bacterium]
MATSNADKRIEQLEREMDELQHHLEATEAEMRQREKELRIKGSPPEEMSILEDLDTGPHLPGLG